MHLPPTPRTSNTLQLLRWIFTPMSYMDECASAYGDIYSLNLRPDYPTVFISNPDALQTILTSDTKELSAPGELNNIFTPILGTQSVITASGKQHSRKRQLVMPALHGERMRAYADIINQVTSEVISQLQIGARFSIRNKLPYLTAVCNETLRIYPVGLLTFPRRVEKPISLCGYNLEPGALIYGSIYDTHRRQDLYPNPEQFKPERFLERQYSAYEFLPFGGGARRCIGLAFAQFEMKLVLAKIVTSVQLELVTKTKVNAKRRGLVSAPDRPIYMSRLN